MFGFDDVTFALQIDFFMPFQYNRVSARAASRDILQLQVFPTFASRLVKPLEISVFTHGLSDMALWAGLAICGSPLRGDDVQKFTFSSTSHWTACL